MHQAKKGRQWYFGMKAHVGVDSKTKIIHTAVVTAANVSDAAVLPDLLHGEETRVWGDGAYQGQSEVIRECAPRARDFTQRRCRYKNQIVDEVVWAKILPALTSEQSVGWAAVRPRDSKPAQVTGSPVPILPKPAIHADFRDTTPAPLRAACGADTDSPARSWRIADDDSS
jgi:hypothetical protein